jgi:hypothetical protein
MPRVTRLFALALLACLTLLAASCATEDKPRGPTDDVSGLPWNRPMPGERSGGALGAMPFQSH